MAKHKKVDVDVAILLELINNCLDLHVLPSPGGLLNQDAAFIHVYNKVQEARAIRAELDSKKGQ